MNATLLIFTTADPRVSPRPAEAIRIAAGVAAWKKVEVAVYLHGPSVLALSEFSDELVDADNFSQYLPLLAEGGRPVLVAEGSPWLREIGVATVPYRELGAPELAAMAARHDYVMRF